MSSVTLASLGVGMDKPKVTREWLIAAGLCVACQANPPCHERIFCKSCLRRFYQADSAATKGMSLEFAREQRRGML